MFGGGEKLLGQGTTVAHGGVTKSGQERCNIEARVFGLFLALAGSAPARTDPPLPQHQLHRQLAPPTFCAHAP